MVVMSPSCDSSTATMAVLKITLINKVVRLLLVVTMHDSVAFFCLTKGTKEVKGSKNSTLCDIKVFKTTSVPLEHVN